MTVTESYSIAHRSLLATAEAFGLQPWHVRVLVALHDRGGEARSDELESDLYDEGALIRRALRTLYDRKLVEGRASDGGPRRPGLRSHITLTNSGSGIVERFRGHCRVIS